LRGNPDRLWAVDGLAKAVYVSPATLQRDFLQIFGSTVRQYHARLRLRGVVECVRANGACIEGILTELGYRGPQNVYRLFRRLTGMTLSDVRRLSESAYARVLDQTLALPNAEWRNHPGEALRQMHDQRERAGRVKGATRARALPQNRQPERGPN